MAKRSRGAARPGQRPTTRRPQQQQRPSGRGAATTSDALRPAARPIADDLETDLELEQELAPVPSRARRAEATAAPARGRGAQTSGLLAARAAQEYGYVSKDIRHIGMVGGGLFIVLIVLWFLIEVVRVITL